ncbi:rhomboid family intramembrane serine protease [Haloarchaeobius sp. HRN-SO-5]|uniref:rhomboid family intramembrane serine protease n=1 Tax=Haloarchaeobius sp. HRN-SO-5 TaxID=3446118 RepID=UPI003EBB749C
MSKGREWLFERLWEVKATLGFGVLVGMVYTLQLTLAGSIDNTAAYAVAREVLSSGGNFLFLSPLFHSYHAHVTENLLSLVIAGSVVERRIGSKPTAAFIYPTGIVTNAIPALIGIGGLSIGISGTTYGLWTFIGCATFVLSIEGPNKVKTAVVRGVLGFLAVIQIFRGVSQFFGFIPVSAGVAAGGHFLGILLGAGLFAGWFAVRTLGLELSLDGTRAES